MASSKIPSFKFKGITAILHPNALCFSPSLGLLLQSSMSLTSNLRSFTIAEISSKFATELYFQRSKQDGRRFGSILPTASLSHASYWMSPSQIGHVLGIAARQVHQVCENLMNATCVFIFIFQTRINFYQQRIWIKNYMIWALSVTMCVGYGVVCLCNDIVL